MYHGGRKAANNKITKLTVMLMFIHFLRHYALRGMLSIRLVCRGHSYLYVAHTYFPSVKLITRLRW